MFEWIHLPGPWRLIAPTITCSFDANRLSAFALRAHQRGVGAQEQKSGSKRNSAHCNSMPAFFTSAAYLSFSLRK
jgi:hypothetical protein